mmetsp:Transcript_98104/g.282215  ORF Transcript_98104/g.282215 Transcript_98104/m.282215 type:complete len:277 (-) Transcript_98104:275-1105(-)
MKDNGTIGHTSLLVPTKCCLHARMLVDTAPSKDHTAPATANNADMTVKARRICVAHVRFGMYIMQLKAMTSDPNHMRMPSRFRGQWFSRLLHPKWNKTTPRINGSKMNINLPHALPMKKKSLPLPPRWNVGCCSPPIVDRSCTPSWESMGGGPPPEKPALAAAMAMASAACGDTVPWSACWSSTCKYPEPWRPCPPATTETTWSSAWTASLAAVSWSWPDAVRMSASRQIVGNDVTARSTRARHAQIARSKASRRSTGPQRSCVRSAACSATQTAS